MEPHHWKSCARIGFSFRNNNDFGNSPPRRYPDRSCRGHLLGAAGCLADESLQRLGLAHPRPANDAAACRLPLKGRRGSTRSRRRRFAGPGPRVSILSEAASGSPGLACGRGRGGWRPAVGPARRPPRARRSPPPGVDRPPPTGSRLDASMFELVQHTPDDLASLRALPCDGPPRCGPRPTRASRAAPNLRLFSLERGRRGKAARHRISGR